MRYISYIVWALLILLVVTFAAVNSHTVPVDFYLGTVNVYLPLLLLLTLALGTLLGIVVMLPRIWRSKGHNRRLRAQIKQAERDIEKTRQTPPGPLE